MINTFGKFITELIEFNWNMVMALLGLGGGKTEVPRLDAPTPDTTDPGTETRTEAAAEIPTEIRIDTDPKADTTRNIMSYLEAANLGATVQEISKHLKMNRMNTLPLLKALVKQGRVDEILGRYYAVKCDDQPPTKN